MTYTVRRAFSAIIWVLNTMGLTFVNVGWSSSNPFTNLTHRLIDALPQQIYFVAVEVVIRILGNGFVEVDALKLVQRP